MIDLRLGDCLDIMRGMGAESVDAVMTDPPAGIGFMGKSWDSDKGGRDKWIAWMSEIAAECLRVLKPGGYALVWSLPRTSHWTGTAWENGGFEPRDRIAYCFGSGFPKSLDVSKAIDAQILNGGSNSRKIKLANDARLGTGRKRATTQNNGILGEKRGGRIIKDIPYTDAAREWAGWGTALKPAIEDWWVFRKPLSEATVVANVLRWGTGALNIDASRIGTETRTNSKSDDAAQGHGIYGAFAGVKTQTHNYGRFPANLITDGSTEVVAMFPQTTTGKPTIGNSPTTNSIYGKYAQRSLAGGGDTGNAARFFKSCPLDEDDYPPLYYCAKASRAERNAGCEDIPERKSATMNEYIHPSEGRTADKNGGPKHNHHPTVKPLSLMRYLITLCTREGATVLDPFAGSGTTGVACVQLGRNFIGCDNVAEYVEIAKRRIEAAMPTEIRLPLFAENVSE